MKDFTKFLDKKNVIALAVSYVIGQAANNFFDGIVKEAIFPYIPDKFEQYKIDKVKIGKIIKLLITFVITLIIAYYITRFSQNYLGFT